MLRDIPEPVMITMPTTIDTARLHLRAPVVDDAECIFEFNGDPEATRYMVWPTADELADVHDFVDDVAAGWQSGDDFCYVITHADANRALGAVICQFDQHGAEIGFIISRHYWGRGMATEAASAVMTQAWTIDDLSRVWATCDTRNLASTRVLAKLGMQFEGRLRCWACSPNCDNPPVPRDAYCYAMIRRW